MGAYMEAYIYLAYVHMGAYMEAYISDMNNKD
jgi:hypothetical protein